MTKHPWFSQLLRAAGLALLLQAPLSASAQVGQREACGDGGGGAADIQSMVQFYRSDTRQLVVRMTLCAPPDRQLKYRVRFDTRPNTVEYPPRSGQYVTARSVDGNPLCLDTDDAGMMLYRGSSYGPGSIAVVGNEITFTVGIDQLPSVVQPDGAIRLRADVQGKGVLDQSPNVDASDGCTAPQSLAEQYVVYTTDFNAVIGTQQFDLLRSPARTAESAMGNLVADAMRTSSGADVALFHAGGVRADLFCAKSDAGEPPCAITFAEAITVLPFGNTGVVMTLTGAQLRAALTNGLAAACSTSGGTGRFPLIAGLSLTYQCENSAPVITELSRRPQGNAGPAVPLADLDTVRVVTSDFLAKGGDGYTALLAGTAVTWTDPDLLQMLVAYIRTNSPVGSVVEGRVTRLP